MCLEIMVTEGAATTEIMETMETTAAEIIPAAVTIPAGREETARTVRIITRTVLQEESVLNSPS